MSRDFFRKKYIPPLTRAGDARAARIAGGMKGGLLSPMRFDRIDPEVHREYARQGAKVANANRSPEAKAAFRRLGNEASRRISMDAKRARGKLASRWWLRVTDPAARAAVTAKARSVKREQWLARLTARGITADWPFPRPHVPMTRAEQARKAGQRSGAARRKKKFLRQTQAKKSPR